MFNCIESDALIGMCRALGIRQRYSNVGAQGDIWIVGTGCMAAMNGPGPCVVYRLSDYLLATAPVDVKEA